MTLLHFYNVTTKKSMDKNITSDSSCSDGRGLVSSTSIGVYPWSLSKGNYKKLKLQ